MYFQLALSDLFEYICYGYTAIRNVRGSTLDVRTDVRFWRLKPIPALKGLTLILKGANNSRSTRYTDILEPATS